ncbi:TPA: fructose-bisphosphate aldolase [Streptococcus pneumoniae]|uniref:class II fructose-bisphosphate aldolase n=1 Tax=Streptococcus pneumoniae TaxID=1313 RepID=UPI000768BBED|nr:class II fructose-bisphosphate aldolase [Streptococcus pneumoniae]VKH32768.1 fructose-bisphosphate aldolase [Streptococcus pneumoniae]VMX70539.1 fructose-bisphosphate aldolase [Streptococcus pneumoniae]VRU41636.1 fructose-bisphosphate aldolase [Streptococcus pneumoniae]VTZ37722.1 fructose-bisphosphate aldolase [Streptococcus pneumoniae]HET1742367.1 fructose-bisphosphate aldolase [Streptococcus pneumoniae]
MAIVSAEKFVQAARDNGYAVGGFNTNNLEWTQAILRASEAKKAPVLIQTSMGAAKYMGGYKVARNLIANLVESMGITVPVAIHLDHGHYEDALECIEVGYTSIMFDGSHLPVEENLKLAKEVVEKAHAKGISVEAEVGTIGGEEDGIIGKGELAPIEDAKAMVETGIDFLAAGIGNIHGPYPVNWEGLDLDHLQKLTEALPGFPIVLHGGSGIPDEQIQAAIKLGVAKVNVNTECQIAFANATRKFARDYEANEAEYDKKKLFDPRKFLADGVKAIQASVEERIDVFGSEGKA